MPGAKNVVVKLGSWEPAEMVDLPVLKAREEYRRGGGERHSYQVQL